MVYGKRSRHVFAHAINIYEAPTALQVLRYWGCMVAMENVVPDPWSCSM